MTVVKGRRRVVSLLAVAMAVAGLAAATSSSAQADGEAPPAASLAVTTIDLPVVPDGLKIVGLALDRAWAYAGLQTGTTSIHTLYRTSSDGTGAWEPVMDPVTDAPLVYFKGLMPTVDNGVVLADIAGSPCTTRLITGPDTARTLKSCGGWTLTQGGDAVVWRSASPPYPWTLYDLEGNVLDSGEAGLETYFAPPVADGVLAEGASDNRITTRKVGSTDLLSSHQLPRACDAWPLLGMRDGNVVVGCVGQAFSALLRQDGSLSPHQMPGNDWAVGNGFVVRRLTPVRDGPSHLEIMDLGVGHDMVEVPTLAYPDAVPDRGDPRSVLNRRGAQELEVLTVAGLQPPVMPSDDDVAPTVEVAGPGPAFAYDRVGPHFTWHGTDPGNGDALDYQSDWKSWASGTPEPEWAKVAPSPNTVTESYPNPGVGGVNLCLRARAFDWAGNVGEWSTRCTYLDAADPFVEWRPSDDGEHDTLIRGTSGVPVRLSWAGGDEDQVRYGVRYWVAPLGRPRGDLIRPAAWTDTTVTSLSKAFAAGSTVCFWIRAEDRAGRQGTPDRDRPRCKTVPMDDRSFALRGDARRVKLQGAYSGTATALWDRRDRIVRSAMRVNVLHVRVVGPRPPSCPIVKIGTRFGFNCVAFGDGAATVYRYRFYDGTHGTLQIRPKDPAPRGVRVDAVWAMHH